MGLKAVVLAVIEATTEAGVEALILEPFSLQSHSSFIIEEGN